MAKKKRPSSLPGLILTAALLVAVAGIILVRASTQKKDAPAVTPSPAPAIAAPADTAVPVIGPASATEAPARTEAEPTAEPSPEPTPVPQPEYFTISMVGDCSMASNPDKKGWAIAYESVINGDMSYPFANTRQYFEDDYLTIANLEGVLSDNYYSSIEWFTFLSPASYADILTEGNVDFVTLANNHTLDFGEKAYNDTLAALDAVGMAHAGENETYIYQTDDGLKIGIYCLYNRLTGNMLKTMSSAAQTELAEQSRQLIAQAEKTLREQGAEYFIACLHMGTEGFYEPSEIQMEMCRYTIDTGFDLVYCTHAHRLQPVESYNGGVIFYGFGNWTFGGHTNPGNGTDPGAYDTVIGRVTVCRLGDQVTLEELEVIPCCIASVSDLENFVPNPGTLNDYQPTPYTEGGKAWERTMSMVNGTYEGANYITDYGNVLAAMNG